MRKYYYNHRLISNFVYLIGNINNVIIICMT